MRPADEASAPEGALQPAAEPVPAPPAELPDLPGIPDDTEGGGDELPYGHPDEVAGLRGQVLAQLSAQYELDTQLQAIRRDMRRAMGARDVLVELRRARARERAQGRMVRKLAAVLTLMADGAESSAAAAHCTDADDETWLQRWAAADPWGRRLVGRAREVLELVWRADEVGGLLS